MTVNRFITSTFIILSLSLAQAVSADDNERVMQIYSMELGGYWNFQKGDITGARIMNPVGKWIFSKTLLKELLPYTDENFYEKTYKKYSGYSRGRFLETKSQEAVNIALLRTSLSLMQQERVSAGLVTRDTITPVYNEHLALAVDRSVDVFYKNYSETFKALGEDISESLNTAMKSSKGQMKNEVYALQKEFELVCEQIEYLRKTGSDSFQLESAQRQEGYEECKDRLERLSVASAFLADITNKIYSIRHDL